MVLLVEPCIFNLVCVCVCEYISTVQMIELFTIGINTRHIQLHYVLAYWLQELCLFCVIHTTEKVAATTYPRGPLQASCHLPLLDPCGSQVNSLYPSFWPFPRQIWAWSTDLLCVGSTHMDSPVKPPFFGLCCLLAQCSLQRYLYCHSNFLWFPFFHFR